MEEGEGRTREEGEGESEGEGEGRERGGSEGRARKEGEGRMGASRPGGATGVSGPVRCERGVDRIP